MLKFHREIRREIKKKFPDCKISLKATRGGHQRLVVRVNAQKAITHLPSTPSDKRSIKNAVANVARDLR